MPALSLIFALRFLPLDLALNQVVARWGDRCAARCPDLPKVL
jgi:hypothetical protein